MKKIIVLLGLVLLLGVVFVFSQAPGRMTKDKTQSQFPSEIETRILQEDPFGNKEVLGYLLRFPISLDMMGTEIGLTENQKVDMANIVKEEENKLDSLRRTNLPAEQYNRQHDAILKATDDKIKKNLSLIQYVRFRDWIIEQWALENNESALKHGLSLEPVTPATGHWIGFMRDKLNLSSDLAQTLDQLIYQAKQDILPLRKSIVELGADPTIPLQRIQENGKQVVKQISIRTQKFDSDLMKNLPLNKKGLYKSYMEIPQQSGSDTKGGNH